MFIGGDACFISKKKDSKKKLSMDIYYAKMDSI